MIEFVIGGIVVLLVVYFLFIDKAEQKDGGRYDYSGRKIAERADLRLLGAEGMSDKNWLDDVGIDKATLSSHAEFVSQVKGKTGSASRNTITDHDNDSKWVAWRPDSYRIAVPDKTARQVPTLDPDDMLPSGRPTWKADDSWLHGEE